MKRIVVSLKKKVSPEHHLITTEYVTDEDIALIKEKYGDHFNPDQPIIQYLSDQLMMVSYVIKNPKE